MNNTPKKLAIAIERVSTHMQEDKFSLGAQDKLLVEYARQNEIKIVKKFVFAETASDASRRKIFNIILDYLFEHENVSCVLVEKIDRLHRNFQSFNDIDRWVIKNATNQVVFVKQNLIIHKNAPSHVKLMYGFGTLVAKNTSDNLSEEVTKGMREKAERGQYPGRAKLGYLNHKEYINNVDVRTIVIDPVRFPLIERCFRYYVTGNYSLRTLSQKMYEEGLTTSSGKKLSTSTMDEVLKDSFYIGHFNWGGKKYINGIHPPAVSRELFDLVQIQLGSTGKGKFRKHAFTYKGLIRCAECGFTVSGSIEKKWIYYGCNHYKPCNQKKYIREEAVTQQVADMLSCLKMPPHILETLKEQLKTDHQSEMSTQDKVLEDLKRRLTVLKNRRDVLYNDRLDGLINLEVWQEKDKQIEVQIEDLVAQIEKYNNKNGDYVKTGSVILELASQAKDIFLRRTSEEKRLLLYFVISKIVLKDGNLEFQLKKPFDIIINGVRDGNWWTI